MAVVKACWCDPVRCQQAAADKVARIMPASTTPVSMDGPAICLLVCPFAELLLDVLVLGPKRAGAVMHCGDTAQTIARGVGFRCASSPACCNTLRPPPGSPQQTEQCRAGQGRAGILSMRLAFMPDSPATFAWLLCGCLCRFVDVKSMLIKQYKDLVVHEPAAAQGPGCARARAAGPGRQPPITRRDTGCWQRCCGGHARPVAPHH